MNMTLTGSHTIDDIDDDGVSNVDELKAWTDPFDPDCFFGLTDTEPYEDGITIKWQTIAGIRYRIQYTDDLANQPWTEIIRPEAEEIESDVSEGEPHWQEFTDTFDPPQSSPEGNARFYRILVVP